MKLARFLLAFVCLLGIAFAQEKVTTQKLDQQELKQLAQLEKKQQAAKKKWLAKKSDKGLKKSYVSLTLKLAHDTMVSPPLPPKEKYPKALRLYREVLKVEPNNEDAAKNKKMIEDIYRSMNRPIPK